MPFRGLDDILMSEGCISARARSVEQQGISTMRPLLGSGRTAREQCRTARSLCGSLSDLLNVGAAMVEVNISVLWLLRNAVGSWLGAQYHARIAEHGEYHVFLLGLTAMRVRL